MITLNDLQDLFLQLEINCGKDICLETKIFLDMNIDSLTIMQIICLVELKFNLEMREEILEFDEDLTIGGFIDLINRELDNQVEEI